MKRIFSRLRYLIFRLVYTFTHWMAFRTMKPATQGSESTAKDSIILVGIELNSPYAVARLKAFTESLPERYRDKQVVLFSKAEPWDIDTGSLNITVVPWEFETRARLSASWMKKLYRAAPYSETDIDAIASRAAAMYDLGDYQLDSSKATGWTANTLSNIVFAKRYGLEYFMMPQSFGPLKYPQPFALVLNPMLKTTLPYAQRIYARESWGVKALNEKLSDSSMVSRSLDMLFYHHQLKTPDTRKTDTLVFVPSEKCIASSEMLLSTVNGLTGCAEMAGFSQCLLYLTRPAEQQTMDTLKHDLPGHWQVVEFDAAAETQHSVLTDYQFVVTGCHKAANLMLANGIVPVFTGSSNIARTLYKELELDSLLTEYSEFQGISERLEDLVRQPDAYYQKLESRITALKKQYPLKDC